MYKLDEDHDDGRFRTFNSMKSIQIELNEVIIMTISVRRYRISAVLLAVFRVTTIH